MARPTCRRRRGTEPASRAKFSLILACAAALLGTLDSSSPATAQCTPAATAGPPVTPPPGSTVTCAGVTTNQNGSNGYGTGDQTGLTINVLTGATVSGTANPSNGISVNSNNTINNSGTISAVTNAVLSVGAITIGNAGSITSQNTGVSVGTDLSLDNAGLIDAFSTGISAGRDANITNRSTGTIHANVLVIGVGRDLTLNNAGTIQGSTTAITAATVDITNSGLIDAPADAVITTGHGSVSNSGTISASLRALTIGTDLTLTNTTTGTIFGNVYAISTGTSLTLNNAGSIGTSINAIIVGTDANIINSGTISGPTTAIGAGGNVTVDNTGSITSSTTAISAGGNASFTNAAGATISAPLVAITAVGNVTGSNSGTVTSLITGIHAGADLDITNTATGTIFGNFAGVSAGGNAIVNNAGSITSSTTGVGAGGSVTFSNAAGATISGTTVAITATGNVTGTNSGTITSFFTGINAGGNLNITNTASGTIFGNANGVISGGSATVVNAGSLTSSTVGVNAGTSANVTNSGTISGNTAGISSGTSATIVNSGTISGSNQAILITTNGDVTNLAGGTISGAGAGIRDNGNLVLNNAGSITSATAGVNAATGQITNTGTINAPTALTFSSGPASVFNAGTLIGSGGTAIQFAGAGNSLTLGPGFVVSGNVLGTGADTFQLGGVGTGSFNATLLGTQYTGFSTFNKVGTSTFNLTGTGAQNWTVQGGTLLANGNFSGTYTVAAGTLGGTGTIGALVAQKGGTIAPGPTIGTLNVGGPVSFSTGSTYQVDLNAAGQSDKIAATGATTLNGGTVRVVFQSAPSAFATAQIYTILTAGSVTGRFDGVASPSMFVNEQLIYSATQVQLSQTILAFNSVAQTPNQIAVANALTAGGLGSALGSAIFNLQTPADARGAFDALSGEIHGSLQGALVDDSGYVRNAVLGRLRSASYAGETGPMAALAFAAPGVVVGSAAGDAEVMAYRALSAKAPFYKAPPIYQPDTTFWAQAFGAWGHIDSDNNAARLDRNLGGFISGVDRHFADRWRIGFAAGYSRSDLSVNARSSSAGIDSYHVAAYAGAQFGGFNLRGGAAFAEHDIATSRTIVFPGFFDTARASYHGSTSQVFGEVGRGYAFGNVAIEPFAGLAAVHVETGRFTEFGGSGIAALRGGGDQENVGYSSLGVRFASAIPWSGGMTLVPRAAFAWQHAFGDVTPQAALAFLSTGAAFDIHGVPLARDAAVVDAGMELHVTSRLSLGLLYAGQLAQSLQDHSVKANLALKF